MSETHGFKKRIYTSAVAAGLLLGSVGVAAAGPSDNSAPASTVDEAYVQEPVYTGSLQAPTGDDTLSEADEAALLAGMATITADDATAAANGAVPGDVLAVELDNENGWVVYSVEIGRADGGHVDVKVDAGDGAVLHMEADDGAEEDQEAAEADESEAETTEADDDAVQHENEDEGQNDPGVAHED